VFACLSTGFALCLCTAAAALHDCAEACHDASRHMLIACNCLWTYLLCCCCCRTCYEVKCVPSQTENARGIGFDRTTACRDPNLSIIIQIVGE
jgi:hypothetical protein